VISSLSPSSQIFLDGVDLIQQRIQQANQQVSSGLKISVASDAPDQIGDLLQLKSNEAMNTQLKSNLGLELTNAQTADSSLGTAIQLMDNATQVAAEGANSTQTAETRATLAQQVQGLMAQMVNISQTQVQGRYIFSGDNDQSPSYVLDLSAPTGVDQVSNAPATRQIQNPEGGTFQASQTAQQIFDDQANGGPSQSNVFNALNSLRVALLNNDSAGITSAQNMIKQASLHLNDAESFYGNVETQIQSATTYSTTYSTQLQAQVGGIEDADVAASAQMLTESTTQLQAAFAARSKIPTDTLFSYLG
jgi:flagellar hook-associated protein 3 FlgL